VKADFFFSRSKFIIYILL